VYYIIKLGACPRTATDLRESRFESVFAVFSGEYRYIYLEKARKMAKSGFSSVESPFSDRHLDNCIV
jgi:hypothetical protein